MATRGGQQRRQVDQRVHDALRIVDEVAGQLCARLGRHIAIDELRSLGRAAVPALLLEHDEARSPLAPFLAKRLRWAILDGVRREARHALLRRQAHALQASSALCEAHAAPRAKHLQGPASERAHRRKLALLLSEHAAAMGMALLGAGHSEAEPAAESSERPDRQASRAADARELRRTVAKLGNPTWRQLIESYYFEGQSLQEIASAAGYNKSWATRQHARAIQALANMLRGSDLDPHGG